MLTSCINCIKCGSGLKKVTADMQTHKNPSLRQGPAPFKAPSQTSFGSVSVPQTIDKPPSFVRDGKKWLIEYQKSNHNLLVDGAEMNNVVYLFKCTDSTITVKGKINSITLDSCKKTSVVFDSLVSSIEFINCQSVQMQVSGSQCFWSCTVINLICFAGVWKGAHNISGQN